jgi:hypothetical protein
MKLKANFLTILKGNSLIVILIREDKKVFFNFGDETWIDFDKLGKLNIKNQRYKEYIESPKFKKQYKDTENIIKKSKDYLEITEKFKKDFKKDRSNKITINPAELEVKDNA